jgi:hypothetical protein
MALPTRAAPPVARSVPAPVAKLPPVRAQEEFAGKSGRMSGLSNIPKCAKSDDQIRTFSFYVTLKFDRNSDAVLLIVPAMGKIASRCDRGALLQRNGPAEGLLICMTSVSMKSAVSPCRSDGLLAAAAHQSQ